VRLANVAKLVELIASLKRVGDQVILVSSGAVGMGCIKLGLKEKPKSLNVKQAVAAAGQSQLMRMYEDMFGTLGLKAAQLLLGRGDFLDRDRWMNVKTTLTECLALDLVPVINENDSTNTEELRFGDNDNLAALCAVQIEADWLFLMTDVDSLFTANPSTDPSAEPIRHVRRMSELNVSTDGTSNMGTGGMATKVTAARTATAAGIKCGLLHGAYPERIQSFLEGCDPENGKFANGTYFQSMKVSQTIRNQRRWILSMPMKGDLILDDGAASAVVRKKGNLLPIGVKEIVTDGFISGECVRLLHGGHEIARAMVSFASDEAQQILGKHSDLIAKALGYEAPGELCHRSNIILTKEDDLERTPLKPVIGSVQRDSDGYPSILAA
jgi:glutamate 5-kinase